MKSDKIELFILYFIDGLMGRSESLDILKFVEKFDGKGLNQKGNGGAWYIEKLSSNFIILTMQSDSPLGI
jgi:hypothetical protein